MSDHKDITHLFSELAEAREMADKKFEPAPPKPKPKLSIHPRLKNKTGLIRAHLENRPP